MPERRTVRVFISSPADVRAERLIAQRVVERLAREFAYHFIVEAVMWEREPLVATAHFQDLIVPPRETDIVVVILWSRLGVPLPAPKYLGALSGRPVTGTEYEFEDAFAGFQASRVPDLLLYRKNATATVELTDRVRVEEHLRQTELVEEFMRRWTRDAESKAFTAAFNTFPDGATFETLVEEHLRGLLLKRVTVPGQETIRWHKGSPYRGLEAFEPEHEQIFFGRTRARNEVRELLTRRALAGVAFLLVMGASGSGKSSLVKAGLLPDLRLAGMIGRVGLVRTAVTRPGVVPDPIDGLSSALLSETALPELSTSDFKITPQRLSALLRQLPAEAVQVLGRGLEVAGRGAALTAVGEARLLLVVDQLEELFTSEGVNQEARTLYVQALDAMARSGLVWVLATMRSDFFAHLDRLPELNRLASGDGKYLLSLPDSSEIAQIVRQPAREAGLRFEVEPLTGRGLDDEILAAATDAASLPLLEYLLEQLWRHRSEEGVLTFAAYRALGGLEGAIGARAEEVLRSQPPDVQNAFPRLLRALVTVGQGAQASATARYAETAQFAADSPERKLIDALVHPGARLLVADGGVIRVAHEALLSHWPRARDQITEDRSDLQLQARLEEAAARWRTTPAKDQPSLLLTVGLPLSEAEDLLDRRREELASALVAFIEESSKAALRRQRLAIRRLQAVAAVMLALLVGAVMGGIYAWSQRNAAERSYHLALAQATGGIQQLIEASRAGEVPVELLRQLVLGAGKTVEGLQVESDEVTAARAELLSVLGLAQVELGDVDTARLRGQEAVNLIDGLVQRHSGDNRLTAQQAHIHGRLSEVMFMTGDSEKTIAEATIALRNIETVLAHRPDDRVLKSEKTDNLERYEEALRNLGRLDEAETVERQWISYAQMMVRTEPGETRWRLSLAAAHVELGDTLYQEGRAGEADAAYKVAVQIIQALVDMSPSNREYLYHLAGARLRLGDSMLLLGDRDGAMREYTSALTYSHELSSGQPAVFRWRQREGVAYERIGELHLAMKNPGEAVVAFRRYQELMVENLRRSPHNGGALYDLANAYQKVGDAARVEQKYDDALAAYREAEKLLLELDSWPVKNEGWRKLLAINYHREGITLAEKGEIGAALTALAKCATVPANRYSWSPRARWPDDVNAECRNQITRLADAHRR